MTCTSGCADLVSGQRSALTSKNGAFSFGSTTHWLLHKTLDEASFEPIRWVIVQSVPGAIVHVGFDDEAEYASIVDRLASGETLGDIYDVKIN